MEHTLNFSSSSASDPGDDPVSELDVSDWEVISARVGEGDDNFLPLLLVFLFVSLEPLLGKDFLRFLETRLTFSFKLLFEECLFLEEVQPKGEQVTFSSLASSKEEEMCRGLLEAEAEEWREEGTVSDDEERSCPSLDDAIMKHIL